MVDRSYLDYKAFVASEALQSIQDHCGQENVVDARILFPRGFIRTAAAARATLPNIGNDTQRKNASYAILTLDTLRWLIIRTDLSGAALSMVVKECICIFGALCDWMTKEATYGDGSRRPFTRRTERLVARKIIESELKDELDWLWSIRCNEHFHEVNSLEHGMYSREDANRAVRAYDNLRRALRGLYG